MTYGETDDGNQLIIPFPQIWTGGHTWIRKGLWFMRYLDSFKTFIENPRSMSGNKYVKTECFSLGRRTAIEILCWETFVFVWKGAFIALEASTLRSSAIGSQFLIKAHWVILLRSANSCQGVLSRELYTGFTCAGPAWWCTPPMWLEVLAGSCSCLLWNQKEW